ncbi:hypothetical protein M422DRAFT_244015 [Sphaerobolus stellatus SS14]|nr:hypothetical protein M422DRAFT_244015 [Sphaerobolus stellatus SS14]
MRSLDLLVILAIATTPGLVDAAPVNAVNDVRPSTTSITSSHAPSLPQGSATTRDLDLSTLPFCPDSLSNVTTTCKIIVPLSHSDSSLVARWKTEPKHKSKPKPKPKHKHKHMFKPKPKHKHKPKYKPKQKPKPKPACTNKPHPTQTAKPKLHSKPPPLPYKSHPPSPTPPPKSQNAHAPAHPSPLKSQSTNPPHSSHKSQPTPPPLLPLWEPPQQENNPPPPPPGPAPAPSPAPLPITYIVITLHPTLTSTLTLTSTQPPTITTTLSTLTTTISTSVAPTTLFDIIPSTLVIISSTWTSVPKASSTEIIAEVSVVGTETSVEVLTRTGVDAHIRNLPELKEEPQKELEAWTKVAQEKLDVVNYFKKKNNRISLHRVADLYGFVHNAALFLIKINKEHLATPHMPQKAQPTHKEPPTAKESSLGIRPSDGGPSWSLVLVELLYSATWTRAAMDR